MYKKRQALKSSLASDFKKLTEEQKVLLKAKPSPSERRVRNMLVADKKDWQYTQSARKESLSPIFVASEQGLDASA